MLEDQYASCALEIARAKRDEKKADLQKHVAVGKRLEAEVKMSGLTIGVKKKQYKEAKKVAKVQHKILEQTHSGVVDAAGSDPVDFNDLLEASSQMDASSEEDSDKEESDSA